MALYYVDTGRRQILKCWAFVSPQLEILWRLLVTRHWLVSYYCCSPFRLLPDLCCFSLAFLLTNSVEKIHNLLPEGSKITGLGYGGNKLSSMVRGTSHLWCDASRFSCYWFHLVVSQEGQTVLDNVIVSERRSKRTGKSCVLRWVRLMVSSWTMIILLTEVSNFTACFPVLVQNIEQSCREGVTAASVCSYPYPGNLLFRVNSSKFPQRHQNIGGL